MERHGDDVRQSSRAPQPGECGSNFQWAAKVREAIRDAVRFWEPMRALYNVILVLIIVPVYVETWPESLETLTPIRLALGVICAVFANIAYCAAYVPDFILQAGGFHDSRWYWRSAIFVTGTLFAAAFAFVFAIAPFLPQ